MDYANIRGTSGGDEGTKRALEGGGSGWVARVEGEGDTNVFTLCPNYRTCYLSRKIIFRINTYIYIGNL